MADILMTKPGGISASYTVIDFPEFTAMDVLTAKFLLDITRNTE